MKPNTTQLRLASINYESGLNEHILYDYDDHSGEILEILTELPESASFHITRINKSLLHTLSDYINSYTRDRVVELEAQIERLEIYKGADHDSSGC